MSCGCPKGTKRATKPRCHKPGKSGSVRAVCSRKKTKKRK